MTTKQLRQKILDLAIHGRLVPQDANDEPASALLSRIRAEKEQLVADGKLKKKDLATTPVSDEDKPFDVPEGWEWCRLGDLAFYKKGPFGSSLTKAMFVPDTPDAYKVYEQKNAIQKDETLGNYFITKEKFEELKGFEVYPNDVIVSCAGTIGETYVMPDNIRRGVINQALMLIRLHLPILQDFYLLYFDFFLKKEATKESKGTAIKNIPPFDVLKNYAFPLPPLAEQQRIVAAVEQWMSLVDIIESGKENLQQSIALAKNKILDLAIKGKLVEKEGEWEEKPLEDVLDYEQPQKYIVETTDYADFYEIPVLTAGKSFIIGYTNESNNVFHDVPVIIFDDFTTDCKYVDFPFKVKSSAMKILHLKGNNDLKYIYYFMSITKLIGETHKRYWISEYSKLSIPLPPLSEQHRIVAKIEELFTQLDIIANALK